MKKKSPSTTCLNCNQPFRESERILAIRAAITFRFQDSVIGLSPPTLCSPCRYQRRLANRNEWSLYNRKCDATGQQILSIYSREKPFTVYSQEYWWSDRWDPLAFGVEINLERPFFEQFAAFRTKVPRLCITNPRSVNSLYTNQCSDNTDCYLLVASNFNKRCFYGHWIQRSTHVMDSYVVSHSNDCYECVYSSRIDRGGFLTDCHNCKDAWFSTDCADCSSVFGCQGLRGKQYQIFNRPVTPIEWEQFFEKVRLSTTTIAEYKEQAAQAAIDIPRKYYRGRQIVASSGDFLEECEDSHEIFNVRGCRVAAFVQDAGEVFDSLDNTETLGVHESSEIEGTMYAKRCLALSRSWGNEDVFYSELCFDCHHLFGCVGLRNKSFCIFNRQYSETDYRRLTAALVEHMHRTGEWGQFFPPEISPFNYNESVAQDYFPHTEEEVRAKGWKWQQPPERGDSYIGPREVVPETIVQTEDDVLGKIFRCQETSKPYRIIKEELELCRSIGVPLPRICPEQRRLARLQSRNPRVLMERQCMNDQPSRCENVFVTSYGEGDPSKVFCETCYDAAIEQLNKGVS